MSPRLIPIAYVLSGALAVTCCLLAWRSTLATDEAGRWVTHTRDVIEALLLVQLEPTAARLSTVAQLTADNPVQQARLARIDLSDRASSAAAFQQMVEEERQLYTERWVLRMRALSRIELFVLLTAAAAATLTGLAIAQAERQRRHQAKIEHGLTEANRFLDSVVENIPNMVFVKEASALRFERINRAGEEFLGIKREDLIGKNDYDFFPRDEAAFFQAKDRQTLESGQTLDIAEEPIQTQHGLRWLHTKKVPIHDGGGKPVYLLGISEDITERKRQAEALRLALVEVQTANQELEAFSYSVAHDLRAPLRAIDGFGLALLEDNGAQLDDEGKSHLARIRGAAQRMGQLIDDLLMLSRVTRQPLNRTQVDLTRLARDIIEELQQQAPARQVVWKIHDRLSAEGDPQLLRVLLENLLGNAFKFTSRRSEAHIDFGRDRDGGFFVRDNGAGFDMKFAEKLFGVFQRLHAMADFPGTGIGLVSAYRIVNRHGGRIWADAQVELGATFHFTLEPDQGAA